MRIFSSSRTVFLDYGASTPIDTDVFLAMKPYFLKHTSNPASLYTSAQKLQQDYRSCRARVADFFHTTPDTITFTSGGTESIVTAIKGIARAHQSHGKHIITSAIEHRAILETCKELVREGFEITYLPVDQQGFVRTQDVMKAVRTDTILISLMHVNNEVGTILPISEIGKEILKYRKKHLTMYPLFHTDACQSVLYLEHSVERLHVDALSCNGAKLYGPKSAGILYVRRGVTCEPLIVGGGQQDGMRGGTIDMAMIVGLTMALERATYNAQEDRVRMLRDMLAQGIMDRIPDAYLNGPEIISEQRVCNNLNVSFVGADGEALALYLDAQGIAVSTGSACSEENSSGSHVLRACGYDETRVSSAIRFTLGKHTTRQDILYVLRVLPAIVKQVREMYTTSQQ